MTKTKELKSIATEQLNINDKAYCTDGVNYCDIVSLGIGGGKYAVQLGRSAQAGSILAGSSVWLRSGASVSGNVQTAGTVTFQDSTAQVTGTIKQNDAAALRQAQLYNTQIEDFGVPGLMGSILGSLNRIPNIINSGQTVTLQPNANYKQNITVSSGGVLRLYPGKYEIMNLTVLAGGKIELMGAGEISVDIPGTFQWDGAFWNVSIQEAASRLRVRVLGGQDIFINTYFGGFVVAPNAHVIVGQVGKDQAGQIHAKRITLHQFSRFLWVPYGQELYIATLKPEYHYAKKY